MIGIGLAHHCFLKRALALEALSLQKLKIKNSNTQKKPATAHLLVNKAKTVGEPYEAQQKLET